MKTELVLTTFDTSWPELRDAAKHAEAVGVPRVWIMDHLSGAVHDRHGVLECWTTLAGLAASTTTIGLGSLVTNAILRNPVVLANSATTVQMQSEGRLTLGLGAGGGPGTPYDDELRAAGLPHGESGRVRRRRVAETIGAVRQVWSGHTDGVDGEHVTLGTYDGYPVPDPSPHLLVAGYGPLMAALAGKHADGFNTSAFNPDLAVCCEAVSAARRESDRHDRCEISAWAAAGDERLTSAHLDQLTAAGVSTMMLICSAPFDHADISGLSPSG